MFPDITRRETLSKEPSIHTAEMSVIKKVLKETYKNKIKSLSLTSMQSIEYIIKKQQKLKTMKKISKLCKF